MMNGSVFYVGLFIRSFQCCGDISLRTRSHLAVLLDNLFNFCRYTSIVANFVKVVYFFKAKNAELQTFFL